MTPWFAKQLLFFLSLVTMPQLKYPPSGPELTREQSVQQMEYKVLQEDQLAETGWQRFSNKRLVLSQRAVPALTPLQYRDLAGWSCGPDAVTRTVSLVTGRRLFTSNIEYTRFALGVPKGLGIYHDHQYDDAMSYNTYGFKEAYYLLWMLNIPKAFQTFLSGRNLKAGAPPQWLAQYMNAYAEADRSTHELEFVYYGTNNFNDMWLQITRHLDKGDGVIPLVASGALQWHYLNIAGYNPETEQVLVLNFDWLLKWSIHRLQGLMYMGFNSQFYQVGEYAAFAASTLVNWFSTVNDYNVIFVRQKDSVGSRR